MVSGHQDPGSHRILLQRDQKLKATLAPGTFPHPQHVPRARAHAELQSPAQGRDPATRPLPQDAAKLLAKRLYSRGGRETAFENERKPPRSLSGAFPRSITFSIVILYVFSIIFFFDHISL